MYRPEDRPPSYNLKHHLMWEKRMRKVWDKATENSDMSTQIKANPFHVYVVEMLSG